MAAQPPRKLCAEVAADREVGRAAGSQTGGEMGGETEGQSGKRRRDSQAMSGRRDGGTAVHADVRGAARCPEGVQADVRVVAVVGAQHVPGLRALLAKCEVK